MTGGASRRPETSLSGRLADRVARSIRGPSGRCLPDPKEAAGYVVNALLVHDLQLLADLARVYASAELTEPLKLAPDDWEELTGISIMSADGWRNRFTYLGTLWEPVDFDEPVSEAEFRVRAQVSTTVRYPSPSFEEWMAENKLSQPDQG